MSKRIPVLMLGACMAVLSVAPRANATDPVTEWNLIAVTRSLDPAAGQAPVVQTRTMAIVQIAVHDAVNAITGTYDTYGRHSAPQHASAEAAAIAAAHQALRTLFPGHAGSLDAAFTASLATHGVSVLDPGIGFGRTVANRILDLRAQDGAGQAQYDYIVPGAGMPGVWIRLNNAAALLPGWGDVTPWVLRSGSQFRPDPPPSLLSETWAKDYIEVMDIGRVGSMTRLPIQTDIANFWRASPTAIWNGALIQILEAHSLDLPARARAFALLYLAAADAGIACWEAKYFYNFWRPFPAIVGGETDGNPATIGDGSWTPLLATPPHPEYPSGHSTNSAAMAAVLRTLFGDSPGVPIQLTFFGVTRTWDTLSQGVDEVIDARVYSGIHYRNSDVVGARLGRQVAHFVMTHALRPPTGSWK